MGIIGEALCMWRVAWLTPGKLDVVFLLHPLGLVFFSLPTWLVVVGVDLHKCRNHM